MNVTAKRVIAGLVLSIFLSSSIAAYASTSTLQSSTKLNDEMSLDGIVEDVNGSSNKDELTEEEKQSNSLAMLNYLTVLSQDVNASKGSRLKLEEMYRDIFDNTRPDRIDGATLDQLIDLSDTIEDYRMIDVKYERLEYLYEQKRAAAVRDAIPDPVSLLSVVRARSIPQILTSMAYMAADSYTGYKDALADASLEYMTEGWELEDEQSEVLHGQRKRTFIYMVKMVNDYDLPGELALSEGNVEKLVSWKNNPNVGGRIQFLESNEDTYKAYGGYWLILAESYYSQGEYKKCLDSIDAYERIRPGILRKDRDYAAALPLAVAAASESMGDRAYIKYASKRAAEIVNNTDDTEWELRYLAAQIYIDLYTVTGDTSYLENAYRIELNNVNELANKQRVLNREYVSPFVEVKAQADATKNQKKEVKNYNKKAKAEHDVALPPVYQPLLVNCDMLFALADKLEVSDESKKHIDDVLHPKGEALFLTRPLDERYRMITQTDESEGEVRFEGTKIVLPASLVSADSNINVTIGKKDKSVPGSWAVKKVKRSSESEVGSYEATLENKEAKGSYSDGDVVVIRITDGEGDGAVVRTYKFKAKIDERFWIVPDAISFEKV